MKKELFRLYEVIGNKAKGQEGILPMSKSAWYAGIQAGRYPQPIKITSRLVAWKVSDLRALIERITSEGTP